MSEQTPADEQARTDEPIPAAVTIDGKEYPLRFTMGAIRRLGKQYGFRLKIADLEDLAADQLMLLASVALINGGADLDLDDAEELLAANPDAYEAACTHALMRVSERLSPGLTAAGKLLAVGA